MPRKKPPPATDVALLNLIRATEPLIDHLKPDESEEVPAYERLCQAQEAGARALERRLAAPRVTLTRSEAAAALGVSVDHFDRHARPLLRSVQCGKLRLWPLSELEKWAGGAAEMELGFYRSRPGDGR